MSKGKIHVFTDIDLDGVTSLLALHWAVNAKPGDVTFVSSTITNLRKEFLLWAEKNKLSDYETVYFLDLDCTSVLDLIDHENVHIIDHHLTHVNVKDNYKHAKTNIVVTTSCAKLLYQTFNLKHLTDKQKFLIVLADDYDCYAFKQKQSYELNCLFTNTQKTLDKTRSHKFLVRFYDGFDSFLQQEQNIIQNHIKTRDETISKLQIYSGDVLIGKQAQKVMGTMGKKFVNEICDYLIKERKADIVFFINPDNSHVSFRKNRTSSVDLSKLAEALCEGGGHEYAAGGKITPTFMDFTKQLTILTT